jgi:phosphatidylinositol alpha-mannosyltransferase
LTYTAETVNVQWVSTAGTETGGSCLRIAVVSPYSWTVPGGVNNIVTSLVSHLERLGHEVWIIAPAGTLTRRAKNLPENFIVAGRTIPVPSNGSIAHANPWPWMLQTMSRILSSHDFDLVHVFEPSSPSVGSCATLVAKVPVVGTFCAAGDASRYYERWRPLAERLLACISVRTAVSEAARDCVSRHFPADYRIIPCGIEIEPYANARGGNKVRRRILFVGRPEPRKGLAVLVEAFNKLRSRMPGVSLTLVGPTFEELHALMPRFSKEGAEKFRGIEALGRISREAKIEQMRRAEVMCAPSLGGESFGIVLTEAMAAGLPVVASDIRGYRAVLADGANGVLVPPGDVLALEEALFTTLGNPELREQLSLDGIERAQRYSWDRVVNQMEEAYADALRLGPRVVEGPKVPVFKQARHFMRIRTPRAKKPQAVRGEVAG